MSAGFDACNLNTSPLEFVSGPQLSSADDETPQVGATAPVEEVSRDEVLHRVRGEVASPRAEERVESVSAAPRKLQRVAEARQQQGFSLRTIARRTGIDMRTLRSHELPTTDMKLSELRAWQAALELPLVDLVEDDLQPLSSPVKERAQLLRIMKTVVAIQEVGGSPRIQRLASMLFEQLVELMPELKEVGGWPQHGSRRSSGSSRILEQQVNTHALGIDRHS